MQVLMVAIVGINGSNCRYYWASFDLLRNKPKGKRFGMT